MGAKKQNKARRKMKTARRRKARRPRRSDAEALQLAPSELHQLVSAVGAFHSCGVDLFSSASRVSGQHSDPRMNLTLADIKAQYPWLAEIGKVFR